MSSNARLPNIDSFSALLDRLIVEHIKRFEFARNGKDDAVATQDRIIVGIRDKLNNVLYEIVSISEYKVISEIRTFSIHELTSCVESLVTANALLGSTEREKLTEALSEKPNVDALTALTLVARIANERRAECRQQIDQTIKAAIEPLDFS